jgi:iron complex outermembrane receptor protein
LNFVGKTNWNPVTARASLLYQVTDRTNTYFTFSQGFKSGIYNTTSISSVQTNAVNPEKVNSYELGIKSSEIDNFSFNAAAFYYDYKDLQVSTTVLVANAYLGIVDNAANAEIYGLEASGDWRISDEFKLTLGGTYLHAKYKKFPNASAIAKDPSGPGNIQLNGVDLSGKTMVRSPSFSGNLTANYTKDTNVGKFDVAATLYYSSKVYYDTYDRILDPSYATLNASLAWSPSSVSGLTLKAWGKNLTNHAWIMSTIITSQTDAVQYAPPLTFGIEAKYAF